jgi:probable O-glycosylation ligase (exosortase A-associated)
MRDILFLALLPLMLYAMAKRPFIGLGMWIWTAMFFPNAWMYGFGASLRYNLIFTGVAIVSYLCLKQKPRVSFGALGALVMLFFFWTTISTATTIGIPTVAWDIWVRFMKVIALFIFVVLIMDKKLHVNFFLWCVVLSIGFYAGLEALKYVASGGGHMIAGFAGHVLGDRNELAVAFVMTLPICAYLLGQHADDKLIRIGLLGLMGLIVTAIIGTQSRGGFIAMLGLAAYMFIKSDRKILIGVLAVVLVVALSSLVPPEWTSRMDTIGTASKDASFMGRVVAWKMSFILASHHPFFGGGFKALETSFVWSQLGTEFLNYSFFYSGDELPHPTTAKAAHSVYFQVMGEHGFVGLLIYLTMLFTAFRKARKIGVLAKKHDAPQWIRSLSTMMLLCIFAFCLGGAALSFAYFELIYAIFGMVVVVESRILPAALAEKRRLQETAAQEAALVQRLPEPGLAR